MKKYFLLIVPLLLAMTIFAGCGNTVDEEPTETKAASVEQTTVPTEEPGTTQTTESNESEADEDIVYKGDSTSYYINEVYAEQIVRYDTALSEKWDEDKYIENSMCEVLAAYYDGNPRNNVGFGFVDLDNDGSWELVIGAIQDAETEPAVFEIWTLVDDVPVMVAQAGAMRQYALQYAEEDNAWYVAKEEVDSVFSHGTYFLMLNEGKFEVIQGIVFDATADKENPWFMTYDQDRNTSNDEPIDEETANAILESNRVFYTAIEYFPYILY